MEVEEWTTKERNERLGGILPYTISDKRIFIYYLFEIIKKKFNETLPLSLT